MKKQLKRIYSLMKEDCNAGEYVSFYRDSRSRDLYINAIKFRQQIRSPVLLQKQIQLDNVIPYRQKELKQMVFVIQRLEKYLVMMMSVSYHFLSGQIFLKSQAQDKTMFTEAAHRRK